MELRARIIEGQDVWYSRHLPQSGKYVFYPTNNCVVGITASCDQKGFDALYAIGKQLWDAGMCSKFEIAAFDGSIASQGRIFWKCRPDQYNFEENRYTGRFDRVIREEYRAYSSPDFQNDALEMDFIQDYQRKFWDMVTVAYSVEYFQKVIENTILYESLKSVRCWLDAKGMDNTDGSPGFEYGGVRITNPFYDESLRFEVEPLSYYGIENMMGFIEQAKSRMHMDKACRDSLDAQIADAKAQVDGPARRSGLPAKDVAR